MLCHSLFLITPHWTCQHSTPPFLRIFLFSAEPSNVSALTVWVKWLYKRNLCYRTKGKRAADVLGFFLTKCSETNGIIRSCCTLRDIRLYYITQQISDFISCILYIHTLLSRASVKEDQSVSFKEKDWSDYKFFLKSLQISKRCLRAVFQKGLWIWTL